LVRDGDACRSRVGDVAQVSDELIAMLQSVLRRNEQPYEIAAQEAKPRYRIIADTYR